MIGITFWLIVDPKLMCWAPDLLIYPGYWSIVWLFFQVDLRAND